MVKLSVRLNFYCNNKQIRRTIHSCKGKSIFVSAIKLMFRYLYDYIVFFSNSGPTVILKLRIEINCTVNFGPVVDGVSRSKFVISSNTATCNPHTLLPLLKIQLILRLLHISITYSKIFIIYYYVT